MTAPQSPPQNASAKDAALPATTTRVIPAHIRELLGPSPLTSLEDAAAYERILAQVAQAVSPKDVMEWVWVKELVDLGWEAGRARRAIAVCIALAKKAAIKRVQEAAEANILMSLDMDGSRAGGVLDGDPRAVSLFREDLQTLGLTEQSLTDVAYLEALPLIEKLQRIADTANARRDNILKEIDRRRDSLARRLRDNALTIDDAIDAQFE